MADHPNTGGAAPLLTAHQERTRQWRYIEPVVRRDPAQALEALANAEAVLQLVADVAGILGTDEAERDSEPAERPIVLSSASRLRLCAGIEAAATMAAASLTDLRDAAELRVVKQRAA